MEFPDVPEAEIEAAVMKVPDLPNGPLPHLQDLLSGKIPDDDPALDAIAAASSPEAAEPARRRRTCIAHVSKEELARQIVTKFALPAAEPEFQAGRGRRGRRATPASSCGTSSS